MAKNLLTNDVLDSLVPISRFNRGEASKIFDEVAQSGCKIVLKNNSPACVLLTPKRYAELLDTIEDYALAVEAERRITNSRNKGRRSSHDVLQRAGISQEELDGVPEVDIE